jgi:zinc transport system permease protein
MFPDFFRASGPSGRKYHLIFDLLVAAGLALATASIGVMGASGLVFHECRVD